MPKMTDDKKSQPKPLTREEMIRQMEKSNDPDVREEARRQKEQKKQATNSP